MKQTTEDRGRDPLVRMKSYLVSEKIQNRNCGDDLKEVLERNQSSGIFRTKISIHNKGLDSVYAFYDIHSTVSEVVDQLRWSLGIKDAFELALFEQSDFECLIIDPKDRFCAVVLQNHSKGHCAGTNFLLADPFHYVPKEESPGEFDVTFNTSLEKFRNGAHPYRYLTTIQLCVLRVFDLQFDSHPERKATEAEIREIVRTTVPHRVRLYLHKSENPFRIWTKVR